MDNVMEITWNIEGDSLYLGLSGRLDTLRAIDLDEKLNGLPDKVRNIYCDFKDLEYIASAGLRILFGMMERTNEMGGEMKVQNVSPEVQEVFHITGFTGMLVIE